MKKTVKKIIALFAIAAILLNAANAKPVFAYFQDSEISSDNVLIMGTLDIFATSTQGFMPQIIDASGATSSRTILANNLGTVEAKMKVGVQEATNAVCANFNLQAKKDGVSVWNGNLQSFSDFMAGTSSATTTWDFEVKYTGNITEQAGQICNFKLVFEGWQSNYDFGQGYSDSEEIQSSIRIKSAAVTLINPSEDWSGLAMNEFLPNPDRTMYGVDMGDDNSVFPQGEWIEIYNGSSTAEIDLSGWKITNKNNEEIVISEANARIGDEATTTIGKKGSGRQWLVVYMNRPFIDGSSNTDGDTLALYDASGAMIDAYTYSVPADYNNLQPTPGTANDETGTGTSPKKEFERNKSIARIPDGYGAWQDPIPTPGAANQAGSLANTGSNTTTSTGVISGDSSTAGVPAYAPNNISIFSINASTTPYSAVISWLTDLASSCNVIYGTSENYEIGNVSEAANAELTEHSITLQNLLPATTYHFKITCINEKLGASGQTGDNEFITQNEPTPEQVLAEAEINATSGGISGVDPVDPVLETQVPIAPTSTDAGASSPTTTAIISTKPEEEVVSATEETASDPDPDSTGTIQPLMTETDGSSDSSGSINNDTSSPIPSDLPAPVAVVESVPEAAQSPDVIATEINANNP